MCLRRRRRGTAQPFGIGVIDLDEVAAVLRIGASLELHAEGFELGADVPGRQLELRDYRCVRTTRSTPPLEGDNYFRMAVEAASFKFP